MHIQFSYSVEWIEEEDLVWKQRMSRYSDSKFLPSSFEIHWLSIINSIVLVLLLTAFLTIILLRVLKNDFSRYMELDDDAIEEEEVSTVLLKVKLKKRKKIERIYNWCLTSQQTNNLQ